MFKLMMMADDFTGALDTGVQLSKAGVSTLVSANLKFPPKEQGDGVDVLVLDLETRHLLPAEACGKVREAATLAAQAGVPYLYKKTDSGMRGNIGGELEGLFTSPTDGPVVFVPAYPQAGRTTMQGIHYSEGTPISQTVFGKDPFNPVLDDYIPDIIARQTGRRVEVVTQQELGKLPQMAADDKILVLDAADSDDMSRAARAVLALGPPRLLAGCAGFAEYLPDILGLDRAEQPQRLLEDGLFVVCGSINQTTLEQIRYAASQGFHTIELTPEQKLATDLLESGQGQGLLRQLRQAYRSCKRLVLYAAGSPENIRRTDQLAEQMGLTLNQAREQIASNLGKVIGALTAVNEIGTLAVFGGDTLMAVMHSIGEDGISPVQEIQSGIVHSTLMYRGERMNLITKSGGFGRPDSILEIDAYIQQNCCKKEGAKAHA